MHRRAYNDPGHVHFLTFSCYRRHQFLADQETCHWLAEAIEKSRIIHSFALWSYVFMPDHVHMLLHPTAPSYSMSAIMRMIKETTTRCAILEWKEHAPHKLARTISHQGARPVHRIWQPGGGYDRNLTEWDAISRATEYIEFNPVRKGYVDKPTDWIWSSARARAGVLGIPLRVDPVTEEARTWP